MKTFSIANATSAEQAATLMADDRFSLPVLKAGGMDIVDHLKEGITEADTLVNLLTINERSMKTIGAGRIGALATLAEIAESRVIRNWAPVLAQSAGDAATPQVRNVASAAGNLLQRPRCWYYRSETYNCLKKGGPTCYAAEGENKFHAIFGDGPCHIVHPSNIALALMVLEGEVHLTGSDRESVSLAELYHMPEVGVRSEHNLTDGEVITHITFSRAANSGFYAIKEKQSFDWPMVMAAAALDLDGSTITNARICAGAVAPVPWMLPNVAKALQGVSIEDEAAIMAVCKRSVAGAKPLAQNHYKLKLLPVAVKRAVMIAAGTFKEEG